MSKKFESFEFFVKLLLMWLVKHFLVMGLKKKFRKKWAFENSQQLVLG